MTELYFETGKRQTHQFQEAQNAVGATRYSFGPRPLATGMEWCAKDRTLSIETDYEVPVRDYQYAVEDDVAGAFRSYRIGVFDPLAFAVDGPLEVGVPLALPEPTGGPFPPRRWITELSGATLDLDAWSLTASAQGPVTGEVQIASGPWSKTVPLIMNASYRLRTAIRHPDRNFSDVDFEATGKTALGDTVKLPTWRLEQGPYLALTRPLAAGLLTRVVLSNPGLPPRPAVNVLSRMERTEAVIFGVPVYLYTLSVPDDATYHRAGECLTVA